MQLVPEIESLEQTPAGVGDRISPAAGLQLIDAFRIDEIDGMAQLREREGGKSAARSSTKDVKCGGNIGGHPRSVADLQP